MDVDLFGQAVEPRKVTPSGNVDLFSPEFDLSEGERLVVASVLEGLGLEAGGSSCKRGRALLGEAYRYANCRRQVLDYQCPRDFLHYFVRFFCHSRICERCARIYVRDLRKTVLPVVRQVTAQRRRGWVLAQVTLTVTSKRHGDGLPDRGGIRRLYQESTEWFRRFYGKYKMVRSRSGKWREDRKRYLGAGWLATVEVGRDNNNLHVHGLVYGPIRPIKQLRSTWQEITGDSFIIDIRAKKPKEVVDYVLKYIAKPPASDSYHRLAEWAEMIKGSRRLRSGGVFYNRLQVTRRKTDNNCPICGARLRFCTIATDPEAGAMDLRAIQAGRLDVDLSSLTSPSIC